MHKKITILLLLFVFPLHMVNGQDIELKAYFGATYYQGDLAPLPIALSFSEGNIAWSVAAGLRLTDAFKVNGRFTLGNLSGDDAQASTEDRRSRNLSFQSPLRELALTTDVSINPLIPKLDKYGINIYFTAGVALFQFDPHTIYKGKIIQLQPLGTEGQTIGYGKPYNRVEYSFPFGMGVKFRLNPRIDLGFEFAPRRTYTDYIDDVSSKYISKKEFLEADLDLTSILSNRTGEIGTEQNYKTGAQRGDPNDNDWYLFAGISFTYRFWDEIPASVKVVPITEKQKVTKPIQINTDKPSRRTRKRK